MDGAFNFFWMKTSIDQKFCFNALKMSENCNRKLPPVISDDEMEIFQFQISLSELKMQFYEMCGRHKL